MKISRSVVQKTGYILLIILFIVFFSGVHAGANDDGIADNSNFSGTYKLTGTECGESETLVLLFGNDEDLKNIGHYIYLPQNNDSYTYSGYDDDNDFFTRTVEVTGNTITYEEDAQWSEDSSQGWTIDITFTFDDNYDGFTYEGEETDDEPDSCTGSISGEGKEINFTTQGDNSKFFGAFKLKQEEGPENAEYGMLIIGNDEDLMFTTDYYQYLPLNDDSYTYSGYDDDNDSITATTHISGDTITIETIGSYSDEPSKGWTTNVTLNFNENYDGFTYEGEETDDDPDKYTGIIRGVSSSITIPTATTEPHLDVEINDTDDSITVNSAESNVVKISLDSGDYVGRNADWWLATYSSSGWQSLVIDQNELVWTDGIERCLEANLIDFQNLQVPAPSFAEGQNFIFFAIDDNADSIPDATWFDYVEVNVE